MLLRAVVKVQYRTQANAILPPRIYGSKRFPASDCYNDRKSHTITDGGEGLRPECTAPPLILHFNHCLSTYLLTYLFTYM